MSEPSLVTVAEFPFAHQAEIARLTLENAGIQCAVFDSNQAGYATGFLVPVRLEVFQPDVEDARRLLEQEELLP